MFFGIALFFRGGKKFILGVVIDHSLCKDFIIWIAFCGGKLFFHKSCYLIHVKVNIW